MQIISRKSALDMGLEMYFTGKPCKNGSIAPRKAKWAKCTCQLCKDEDAKSSISYYRKNTDKCKERNKNNYEINNEERKSYAKRRHEENREEDNNRSRFYHQKNAKKIKELARDYNAKNRGELAKSSRERSRRHYKNNPEKYHSSFHFRRSAKLRAVPKWYGELDELVIREARSLCKQREADTGIKWHVDHSIPLQAKSACGLHCAHNIQVSCSGVHLYNSDSFTLVLFCGLESGDSS